MSTTTTVIAANLVVPMHVLNALRHSRLVHHQSINRESYGFRRKMPSAEYLYLNRASCGTMWTRLDATHSLLPERNHEWKLFAIAQ